MHEQPVEIAFDLDLPARDAQPARRAVAPHEPVALRFRRTRRRRIAQLRDEPRTIVRAAVIEHVADRLVGREAKHAAPRLADELHAAVRRHDRDPFVEILHELAQPRLVAAQLLTDRLFGADVAKLHHHDVAPAQRHVGRDRLGQHVDARTRPVAPLVHLRAFDDRAVHRADADLATVFRLRPRHVRRLQRQQLLDGKAERNAGRTVRPDDRLGLCVVQQHAGRQRIEQPVEIVFVGEAHGRVRNEPRGIARADAQHSTGPRRSHLKISLGRHGASPVARPSAPIAACFRRS
ncbi:hypothetical protein FEP14_03882 [Burkholderia multivorans]|nr:hypothetical protein [Burkholderia multivorans]